VAESLLREVLPKATTVMTIFTFRRLSTRTSVHDILMNISKNKIRFCCLYNANDIITKARIFHIFKHLCCTISSTSTKSHLYYYYYYLSISQNMHFFCLFVFYQTTSGKDFFRVVNFALLWFIIISFDLR
jgi:hypothetical protein